MERINDSVALRKRFRLQLVTIETEVLQKQFTRTHHRRSAKRPSEVFIIAFPRSPRRQFACLTMFLIFCCFCIFIVLCGGSYA
jgi:hypothetical protein